MAAEPGQEADYCRDAVRRGDRDRYLTLLFAPADRRDALMALTAFNLEVARAREQVSEPMLGLIRLQWWREALEGIYGDGPVRRHPVAEALAATVRRHSLPASLFEQLLTARERDMDPVPNADMAALEAYAGDTAGSLLMLMAQVLAPAAMNEDTNQVLHAALIRAGIGYALTGLLRAIPFHAASGRSFLPQDRLETAGLSVQDLAQPGALPARASLVSEIAAIARRRLDEAKPVLRRLPRAASPIRLQVAMTHGHLDRLAAAEFEPHNAAVQSTPPWTIWRLGYLSLVGGV